MKWTEDKTVLALKDSLEKEDWRVVGYCTGHKRGTDIVAQKKGTTLHIEVKGARGNDNSHVTTRKLFSRGQIKTHFGVAIVKAISLKLANPDDRVAIAHPDDGDIRSAIGQMTPLLTNLNIEHFWVSENGFVTD